VHVMAIIGHWLVEIAIILIIISINIAFIFLLLDLFEEFIDSWPKLKNLSIT
jgi:hypothetical protein